MSLKLLEPRLKNFFDDTGVTGGDTAANQLYYRTVLAHARTVYREKHKNEWSKEATMIGLMIGRINDERKEKPKDQAVAADQGVGPGAAPQASGLTAEEKKQVRTINTKAGALQMMKMPGGHTTTLGTPNYLSLEFGPRVRDAMKAAAAAGHRLVISSAVRPFYPKSSNHIAGNAVDFDQIQSSRQAIDWMHANAAQFGMYNKMWRPPMAKIPATEYNHFSINGQ